MATIDRNRSHDLGLDTARTRAEALANELQTKLGIAWRWEGDNLRFSSAAGVAKGVKGTVSVSSSTVRVEIDLPFLMRALKGTIGGKVDKKLDGFVA
jgi:putative polyhydroxyalkanoate system protein